jgi:6-phosphogluconolactonase
VSAPITATVVYVGNADSQDVSVFELRSDGQLAPLTTLAVQRPVQPGRSMQLALAPDGRFLYVAYLSGAAHSAVATYAIGATGLLSQIGVSSALADIMAYIVTDRSGRFLLGASYAGNKVTVNAILPDGRIGETLQIVPTAPKAHCIVPDPSNRYVLHSALGGDLIYQQLFNAGTGRLSANTPPTVSVQANAGPRFLTFSHAGDVVYVIDELDGSIHVFPFDVSSGTLQQPAQLRSALPPGFNGRPWAADIHLTPNGRFLYACERSSSTLSAFRVDPRDGLLTSIDSFATVRQPRAFNIDPAGSYLLSTGQLSNSVMVHAIDPSSGRLAAMKEYPVGSNPTWVEVVRLPAAGAKIG